MNIATELHPEDVVRVLLPAEKIPEGSTVLKRTGEKTYTLRRELTLYTDKGKEVLAQGFFLCDGVGNSNQVSADTLLHWEITAEGLFDHMECSWAPTPQ